MICICRSGRNPTMRHIGRTHGVCASWLKEVYERPENTYVYDDTTMQAADIYTKGFSDKLKWQHAHELINVCDPSRINAVMKYKIDIVEEVRIKKKAKSDALALKQSGAAPVPPSRGGIHFTIGRDKQGHRGHRGYRIQP